MDQEQQTKPVDATEQQPSTQQPQRRVYKLKRDPHDARDLKFSGVLDELWRTIVPPPKFDIMTDTPAGAPAILNQLEIGSCACNEISNALKHCLEVQKAQKVFQPSRLALYYWGRQLDGSPTDEDTGITLRSGFKAVAKFGAIDEMNWPYNIDKYTEAPPANLTAKALVHTKGFKYVSVPQSLTTIKKVIASGFPVVIGIQAYESLESDAVTKTGVIPMPDKADEQCLGGHAVALYGYDDKTRTFVMMNSWGTDVGQKGWFTIPYDYVLDKDLASDFWVAKFFV